MTKLTVRVVLCSAVALLLAVPGWSQVTGSFIGNVKDPSGAAIANAKITAVNASTGLKRDGVSNSEGQYVIPLLPPGNYNLHAEASGFQTQTITGLVLLVNETARADVNMTVASRNENVEVSGQVAGVETANATLNVVIDQKDVENLPLNGRNFLQLTTLVPGSVPGIKETQNFTPTTAGTNSVNIPQVNGLREQSNNVLLDGVDNNELFLGEASAVPSPDAIQEFSVQTNLYGAEFGRGAGSIVNVVTKSGTDKFHGSLYDYFRNDALDASDFFAVQKPPLRRNQFGGSFGGPIIKKKTHFFGSYEGLRLTEGVTQTAIVPTVLEKQGNFSQSAVKPIDPSTGQPYPNNTIPTIDPVAAKLLQFYPDPNLGGNLFVSSPSAPTTENQFLVRVDHEISSNDSLTGRYYYQNGHAIIPFATTFLGAVDVPDFPIKNNWGFQHIVLSETHVFSPKSVNEFRFGFHRDALIGLAPATPRSASDYGFTFPATIPIDVPQWAVAGMTVNGYTDMGPGNKATNVFQWIDIFSHSFGRHTLKVGADIRRNQMNLNIPSAFNGAYDFAGNITGNAFADFLIGRPQFFTQGGGNAAMHFRASDFDFFGEDSIAVTRRLKLTLGLRYERPTWPYDLANRIAAFRPGEQSVVRPDAPVGLVYPGDPGVTRSTLQPLTKDFAPRVGLAWDPFGTGKTSVRAGYGIFYDPIPWHNFNQLQIAPPFSFFPFVFQPTSFADPYNGAGPFLPGLTQVPFSAIPQPFQFNVFDQHAKSPYAQQYNLTLQHSIGTWVLQAGYVGTTGIHLPNTLDENQAVYIPGSSNANNIEDRRPYGPVFSSIEAQATVWTSNYNSLQTSVTKRAGHGLTLLAAYTYSKSIDTISTPQAFRNADGQQTGAMNNYDLKLDRGPSAFDATHRLVVSYEWDLPRWRGDSAFANRVLSDWSVLGIYSIQSGLPFTVLDPTDPSVDGNTNDRPNLVGNPGLANRSILEWFNTAAFQRVPIGDGYGDAGRNDLRGPRSNNFDFSMVKKFVLKESANLEYRAEFFNLFNHPQFANPISDITSPNFGQIISTKPDSQRQIQMVLRLNF